MRKGIWMGIMLGFWAAFFLPGRVWADGIIIPEPPPCSRGPCPPEPFPIAQLVIRYHEVQVSIEDQVATTRVDQVFYNPNQWDIEGRYLFPIPPEAVVSDFKLWIDGEPVAGQVLNAEDARRTYEDIVNRLRDPALLEYAGQGALQARVFPIPAGGERRIQLEYNEVLHAENGLVRYLYPLNTEKFSLAPLENVLVSVNVQSSQSPIQAVYSPSHPITTQQASPGNWEARYEASQVRPDTDFLLYYALGDQQALYLLTYRDSADEDGYFLLLAAPPVEADQLAVPKDLVLVLDRSGSMDGEKFQQARAALSYILKQLNPEDRFNVIAFSSQVELFAPGLRTTFEMETALDWVERLNAAGSTNIYQALQEAMQLFSDGEAEGRPGYVIFLTDGLPTEGVVESAAIIDLVTRGADMDLRLFPFGVGYDVDTFLLDSLAQEGRGASQYVRPGEPLDEILSAFYNRIRAPILTNPALDFGKLNVYDLYPQPLPDLFAGSQLVLTGRYRDGGEVDLRLNGWEQGEQRTFIFPNQVFPQESQLNAPGSSASLGAIPRLWATRKIGYLLNQLRLNGPDQETVEQIVQLSLRYGIVTPYTSYLITEEVPLGGQAQSRAAQEAYEELKSGPPAAVSGQGAVDQAAAEGAFRAAEAAEAGSAAGTEAGEVIKLAASHTFILQEGVWVDTTFDPEHMAVTQVPFLSAEYYELARASTQTAAGLAVGERVIVVVEGVAYEVVPNTEIPSSPPEFSPTLEPSPVATTAYPQPVEATSLPPQSTSEPAVSGGTPCAAPLPLLVVGLGLWFARSRRR